eukprot:ctg_806.g173
MPEKPSFSRADMAWMRATPLESGSAPNVSGTAPKRRTRHQGRDRNAAARVSVCWEQVFRVRGRPDVAGEEGGRREHAEVEAWRGCASRESLLQRRFLHL